MYFWIFQFAWTYFFEKYSSWLSQIFWYPGMKMLSKNLVGFYLSIVYLSIFSCEHINFWIPHLGIVYFSILYFRIFCMGSVYLSILYLWAFLLVDLLHGQCLLEHSLLVSIFTCGSFAWAVFTCILYLSIFTCVSSAWAMFTWGSPILWAILLVYFYLIFS